MLTLNYYKIHCIYNINTFIYLLLLIINHLYFLRLALFKFLLTNILIISSIIITGKEIKATSIQSFISSGTVLNKASKNGTYKIRQCSPNEEVIA